jgi:hypothetical protein
MGVHPSSGPSNWRDKIHPQQPDGAMISTKIDSGSNPQSTRHAQQASTTGSHLGGRHNRTGG